MTKKERYEIYIEKYSEFFDVNFKQELKFVEKGIYCQTSVSIGKRLVNNVIFYFIYYMVMPLLYSFVQQKKRGDILLIGFAENHLRVFNLLKNRRDVDLSVSLCGNVNYWDIFLIKGKRV